MTAYVADCRAFEHTNAENGGIARRYSDFFGATMLLGIALFDTYGLTRSSLPDQRVLTLDPIVENHATLVSFDLGGVVHLIAPRSSTLMP